MTNLYLLRSQYWIKSGDPYTRPLQTSIQEAGTTYTKSLLPVSVAEMKRKIYAKGVEEGKCYCAVLFDFIGLPFY